MSWRPLVTVVVPIYNAERFLRECIESVLAQEYGVWELMLVDDGSTDSSATVARGFAAARADRIHFLRHDGGINRGSSATRNLGVRHGRGELVTFLDADDVWLPCALEEMVATMERHAALGFAYGRGEFWHSWNGRAAGDRSDHLQSPGIQLDTLLPPRHLLERMIPRKAMAPLMGTLVVRRRIFDQVGGFESTFTGLYDDQVLVAKLNLVSPGLAVDRVWHRYRQHPDSMYTVARAKGNRAEARGAYLGWLKGVIVERGLGGTELDRLVDREIAAITVNGTLSGRSRVVRAAGRIIRAIVPARLRTLLKTIAQARRSG